MNKDPRNIVFDWFSPTRILFGPGSIEALHDIGRAIGKLPLLVTGKNMVKQTGLLARIQKLWDGPMETFHSIEPDPCDDQVMAGVRTFEAGKCDWLLAVGGGSVIDAAKAMALVLAHGERPLEYTGQEISLKPLAVVAVPTTAGTGSEVTRYAVISDSKQSRKVTIKNRLGCPAAALVDPALTLDLPPYVTWCTGVDAFIHCFEALVSRESAPLVDSLALRAIGQVIHNLPLVDAEPKNLQARVELHEAALVGGLVINTVRTGIIHTMANHLGARYHLAHGHSLGVLASVCTRFNAPTCGEALRKVLQAAGVESADPSEGMDTVWSSLLSGHQLDRFTVSEPPAEETLRDLTELVSRDRRLFEVNPRCLELPDITQLYREVFRANSVGQAVR